MTITLPENKFKISQQFIYYADKQKRVWTIEDVIYQINSKGEVLGKQYRCYCEVISQKVFNDFPEASIALSILV